MSRLALRGIHRRFGPRGRQATALDGVDLTVEAGATVALVGESGSGKTTLARIAVGLERPDAGTVTLDGAALADARGRVGRAARAAVQMVFQDPLASFNPARTVGAAIALPLALHLGLPRAAQAARAAELLVAVGLDPALGGRRPRALSGGELQRAAIARALASAPRILVCDEPVASLDVSVRAQVLNLLARLRAGHGTGLLFVSHDLGVVARIADRTAVMYLGRIVEEGPGGAILAAPRHPYTAALAAAVPDARIPWRERPRAAAAGGEMPGPFAIPAGCRFRPRCPRAIPACAATDPALVEVAPGWRVACIRAGEDSVPPPVAKPP
ncbi:MAG: ABC transporter ATP-binding protein [Rhodobacteraceae bacterium]|nr:ABC transporter ATP-binding protein [Paracoccaceae bacterium]